MRPSADVRKACSRGHLCVRTSLVIHCPYGPYTNTARGKCALKLRLVNTVKKLITRQPYLRYLP